MFLGLWTSDIIALHPEPWKSNFLENLRIEHIHFYLEFLCTGLELEPDVKLQLWGWKVIQILSVKSSIHSSCRTTLVIKVEWFVVTRYLYAILSQLGCGGCTEIQTSTARVANHGERIALCLPSILNLCAIYGTEMYFLWNMDSLITDKRTGWNIHCM
jgi:hypothetical protein